MASLENQLKDACKLISVNARGDGIILGRSCETAAKPILLWHDWYLNHRPASFAKELLEGLKASILESIAYVSLGLGRAAITAIRMQIDLLLSFSFFRDHPAEWQQLVDTGKGFRLKFEIYKYHSGISAKFEARLKIIETAANVSLDSIYKVLSAHVHGQSPLTIPQAGRVADLVWKGPKLQSVVEIQHSAATALSNFLVAVHAPEWAELPDAILLPAKDLVPEAHRSDFFA